MKTIIISATQYINRYGDGVHLYNRNFSANDSWIQHIGNIQATGGVIISYCNVNSEVKSPERACIYINKPSVFSGEFQR